MNPEKIREIYRLLSESRPNPQCELNFNSPYELLVATALAAQATDKGVNLATAELFPVANTPKAIAALGEAGLIPFVRSIGLYRSKAAHIIEAANVLLKEHNGEVPQDFDSLVKLPGVGPKTAKVVLNVAFGLPYIPVDTHIFRVANRTGLAPEKTPNAVSEKLEKITPAEYITNAHHWLLLHGRYCCKARSPQCRTCPIAALCEFQEKVL